MLYLITCHGRIMPALAELAELLYWFCHELAHLMVITLID